MTIVTRFIPYSAMAVYPFIFIKQREMESDAVLIHHEKIHHRQQLELLLVPFYLIYLINYLYNLLVFRNHYKAYKEIVFEREAFAMEHNFDYLRNRKPFAFTRF